MKIEINLTMKSKDPKVIQEMLELVNYIKSGGLQRDMSKDSPMARFKRARVKATVKTIQDNHKPTDLLCHEKTLHGLPAQQEVSYQA